jgi:hypothetical protein
MVAPTSRTPSAQARPAVPLDDPLDIGQADARAFELILTVQTLEDAESLLAISRIKTGAIVANVDHGFRRPQFGLVGSRLRLLRFARRPVSASS